MKNGIYLLFGKYQAYEIIRTIVLDQQLFISFLIQNSFEEIKSTEHDHHLIIVIHQMKDKILLFLSIIHLQLLIFHQLQAFLHLCYQSRYFFT